MLRLRRIVLTLAAGFAAGLVPTSGSGQSFDCRKANTPVERSICADRDLARLDEELGRAYRDARARVGPESIGQAAWLKTVRDACANIDCLAWVYESRVRFLKVLATAEPMDPEGLAGGWERVGTSPSASAGLTIESVAADRFAFGLGATLQLHGDPGNVRVGSIEGVAIVRGRVAIYRDADQTTGCEVTFVRTRDGLTVHTSECAGYAGMGVTFDGAFQRE